MTLNSNKGIFMMKKLAVATSLALSVSTAAMAQHLPGQSQGPGEAGRIEQSLPPRDGDRPQQPSFDTVDENADGRLSRAEASVVDGFSFSRADTNDDAALTRREYAAAIAGSIPPEDGSASRHARPERTASRDNGRDLSRQSGDPVVQLSFSVVDKNKDGRVNRQEASAIPGFDFARADSNDDATLTRQEFQNAMASPLPRG